MQYCIYRCNSHGTRQRTAAIGGNMASASRQLRGSFSIPCTLVAMSESNMKKRRKSKMVAYQLKPDQRLTSRQKREIQNLAAMPEDQIDTSDIQELPPEAWKNAVRGKWYRPLKKAVSIRLDADVLAWLKAKGSGYQTKVNSLLRERMLKEISR